MPVDNAYIATLFNRLADLLEIEGDNPFNIRAYRDAAEVISGQGRAMADMLAASEDLTELPRVGKEIAKKIEEIVHTGRLTALQEAETKTPPELLDLLSIPGLGAKRVGALHHELNISNPNDLKAAAEAGKIQALSGFGQKLEAKILDALRHLETREKRFPLYIAADAASSLTAWLSDAPGVGSITVAGSFRRQKETVGDLDILAICDDGPAVMDRLVDYGEVREVVSKGDTRSTVILTGGLQVDVRVVPQESYGAALQFFTGSKAHNVAVRKLAAAKGLKINEYGVFRVADDVRTAGAAEDEVYAAVGLPFIEPVLRQGLDEIELATAGRLPRLVAWSDVRGDLHLHTQWSDGRNTIEEMALSAKAKGYAYLAITDHCRSVATHNVQDPASLRKQLRVIDQVNERLDGVTVLKGAEMDILEDGLLDLADELPEELDVVLGSIHSAFDLPADKQTERVLRAMDNPRMNILAHPTSRLIGQRPPCALEMERIIAGAKDRGVALEVSARPERLDLSGAHCRQAKEIGAALVLSTDSHSVEAMETMPFGLAQAGRGGLEPQDILNTGKLDDLLNFFKR